MLQSGADENKQRGDARSRGGGKGQQEDVDIEGGGGEGGGGRGGLGLFGPQEQRLHSGGIRLCLPLSLMSLLCIAALIRDEEHMKQVHTEAKMRGTKRRKNAWASRQESANSRDQHKSVFRTILTYVIMHDGA